MPYDHNKIEKKWQEKWEKSGLYRAEDFSKKPKFYCLDMFPYPSGEGLHVGHPEGYTATDIYSRYLRAKGYNVLHPMGWDAFGLPAENYAIKKKKHPQETIHRNIDNFRRQIKRLGFSYDWSREINTTDPRYYRWTQWIFLQLFKRGLAYEATVPINWCPSCKTGLANEEVVNGTCERCHAAVTKKNLKQWLLKITAYADRLLKDVDLLDWPERIKEMQRNWIGKSEGYEVKFQIQNPKSKTNSKSKIQINVFTTRVDTLYGATYLALAPEHPLLPQIVTAKQKKKVEVYQAMAKAKSDLERTQLEKEKNGVFTGAYAINPANGQAIPIWVADYVMMTYAQGAIMCVPAHDERDFAFAKKYDLPIKEVIEPLFRQANGVDAVKKDVAFRHRDSVVCIIKHWQDNSYLCLKWKKTGWKGFVVGGIEPGEDMVEAGLREIKEETGFQHIKFVKKLGGIVHSQFYQPLKKENRWAHFQGLYFELADGGRDNISTAEDQIHEVEFISQSGVKDFLNTNGDLDWLWERFLNPASIYVGVGIMANSGNFNGKYSEEAKQNIAELVGGKRVTQYKLHDWVFSRQRYWGEPIPVIHCGQCGVVPVPEKDLPVLLPDVKKYEPTGTGESPLAAIDEWVNVECPQCSNPARRETNTMPNWAGSCWYYLRYLDPHSDKEIFDKKKMQYWCPVDLYVGGAEHAVLHLLYARFWHKVLYDAGYVDHPEPFIKLLNQGLILGEDGVKMSKSRGNVINPDAVVEKYGADTLRLYEMFMGPFADAKPWDTKGIIGVRRFLERVWEVVSSIIEKSNTFEDISGQSKTIHKTIKEITGDIENFKFNTAVSKLMIFFNGVDGKLDWRGKLNSYGEWENRKLDKGALESFLQLLAPFAPHLAEELWEKLGHKKSIFTEAWPKYDEKIVKSAKVQLVVQINGKVRDKMEVDADITQDAALKLVRESGKVKKWVGGKTIIKEIYVPGRLVNIVLR